MRKKNMEKINKKIAIIGSGISGLSCAWHLNKFCDVTIFEANEEIGGHSHWVNIGTKDKPKYVDMGFIVFNNECYPNLIALFENLKIKHIQSNMSFGVSMDNGKFEYSSLNILSQKINLLRPRFWKMILDINRFYKNAPKESKSELKNDYTLGQYLKDNNYSKTFIDDHLIPQAAAIWSTSPKEVLEYPFGSFLGFFENHGLLELDMKKRIEWRTILGSSREYVMAIKNEIKNKIKTNCPINKVKKIEEHIIITDLFGNEYVFDEVVFACHPNEALKLIENPSFDEKNILGAINYSSNEVILHCDEKLMPKIKSSWASWNFIANKNQDNGNVCVTYWMNLLQSIGKEKNYFVTLNPIMQIDKSKIIKKMVFDHPKFDAKALEAQKNIVNIQGKRGFWFAGAYMGFGFHEDGIQAGLCVAENICKILRPWAFDWSQSRIPKNLNPRL